MNSPDTQNARNMRDFLELYNKLTEMCFLKCVSNFNNIKLSKDEGSCVGVCVDRYVKYNQRLMMTFMEYQNAKQEAAIKEMEKAHAEGRTPNVPGLAAGLAASSGSEMTVAPNDTNSPGPTS
ncbi:Tim10/DDP zinc finger [Mactra antiquata]